jgi:hypothetical protein
MVESYHAATKVDSVHKKNSAVTASQELDQKVQRRFDEKHVSSRQEENQLGWVA